MLLLYVTYYVTFVVIDGFLFFQWEMVKEVFWKALTFIQKGG